jgi:hypothetical protein
MEPLYQYLFVISGNLCAKLITFNYDNSRIEVLTTRRGTTRISMINYARMQVLLLLPHSCN